MSRPDTWSSPRPHTDASLRLHHYGPIEPMAADWATASKRGTLRLTALVAGLGIALTLLFVGVGL